MKYEGFVKKSRTLDLLLLLMLLDVVYAGVLEQATALGINQHWYALISIIGKAVLVYLRFQTTTAVGDKPQDPTQVDWPPSKEGGFMSGPGPILLLLAIVVILLAVGASYGAGRARGIAICQAKVTAAADAERDRQSAAANQLRKGDQANAERVREVIRLVRAAPDVAGCGAMVMPADRLNALGGVHDDGVRPGGDRPAVDRSETRPKIEGADVGRRGNPVDRTVGSNQAV